MKRLSIRLLAMISILLLSACENFIYDGEGDCTTVYQLNFIYDYNMKFANAFEHEVKTVSAFLFDSSGTLAYTKTEQVGKQNNSDYKMILDIQPGTYDVLVWAGVDNTDTYKLPDVKLGKTKKEELTCWMNRYKREGVSVVDKQLPFLFHGMTTDAVFCSCSGIHTVDVNLVKNTNTVRLVLQQLSGDPVDASLFDFRITDNNGFMNWNNSLIDDEELTYQPWSVSQGTAGMQDGTETGKIKTQTEVSVALAEFAVNRLVMGHRPIVSVFNKQTHEKVLSIPLIDYALLVKGNYNKDMSDQEYLDRQDEYNLTFFLDSDNRWVNTVIYINSWRVVLHDVDL